jgi:ferredoxin
MVCKGGKMVCTTTTLSEEILTTNISNEIGALITESAYYFNSGNLPFDLDDTGKPCVKVSIGTCSVDFDLWENLRNPATLGLYPLGLLDIWNYYATLTKPRSDESGRTLLFEEAKSPEWAIANFCKAAVASIMLPFSANLFESYAKRIELGIQGPISSFQTTWNSLNDLFDKAVTRTAMNLCSKEVIAIPMTKDLIQSISSVAVPQIHQGTAHGPFKGGNWPQKSIAVLCGLGQFGVGRSVIRDELSDGQIVRYLGPLRSIVFYASKQVFNKELINLEDKALRIYVTRLADFTDSSPQTVGSRFCLYQTETGDSGCRMCHVYCPSTAIMRSSPNQQGCYPDSILGQKHRFYNGKLQFDASKCREERSNLTSIYPDWGCSRCIVMCSRRGGRNPRAVESFWNRIHSSI